MGSGFLGVSLNQLVDDKNKKKASRGTKNIAASSNSYTYLTGIVSEFISEPDDYLSRFNDVKKEKKVINGSDYEIMVKNCIVAYIIDESEAEHEMPPVICYPFFPHMSLPVKAGEHVWLLKEENFGRDLYYWISRKVGFRHTEDINYTNPERFNVIDEKLLEKESDEGGSLFNEKNINKIEAKDLVSSSNTINSNLPKGISTGIIQNESLSYMEDFTPEPVPPVRIKSGDTLINGSNNSLFHMTTEKFLVDTEEKSAFGVSAVNSSNKARMPLSPAIDICVGRKKEELTALKNTNEGITSNSSGDVAIIKNERGSGFKYLENYEINKVQKIFDKNDNSFSNVSIDTDPTNCGARLYLSNNCSTDEIFSSAISGLSSLGGSSIVTYSDHNRVVADESLRLVNRLGQSFLDMNSEGKVRIQGKTKIELAVREDSEAPSEPYVLYSELKDLLDKITGDISFINLLLEQVLMRGVLGPLTTSATVNIMDTFDQLREQASQSGDIEIEIPQGKDENGKDLPPETKTISTTFLGGNITTEKMEEWGEILNTKMKSTKIFGEAND